MQNCRIAEGVELKILHSIHALTWHSPILQFFQELRFLSIGLNCVAFCVITPPLSKRDDCCSLLSFNGFCVYLFLNTLLPYFFLALEQTCGSRSDSFVSVLDLLDHCASQILLRGYIISTRFSGMSFIFCGFNHSILVQRENRVNIFKKSKYAHLSLMKFKIQHASTFSDPWLILCIAYAEALIADSSEAHNSPAASWKFIQCVDCVLPMSILVNCKSWSSNLNNCISSAWVFWLWGTFLQAVEVLKTTQKSRSE